MSSPLPVDGADPRWWIELRSCALVGTGRRAVPEVPELAAVGRRRSPATAAAADAVDGVAPPDPVDDIAGSAVALLDAAALGAVARRTGRRPRAAPWAPLPAVPDTGPDPTRPASATAAQLLELLLGPAPMAGIHRNDLVAHWCTTGAERGRPRAPDTLVVALLDHGTSSSTIRGAVVPALGPTGWWLAELNPDWAWAVPSPLGWTAGPEPQRIDPAEWARLASARRVEVLAELRRRDPAAGRELLVSTWSTDSAAARATHLAVLADGVGPDDEPILDAALDDRGKGVRQQAAALLDALPGSARAQRMAERLRPLLSIEGRRRNRSIVVALPDDPDDAGARDGLLPAPTGRSARGFWLERLVAGAPLEVWTELTGEDIETTVDLLAEAVAEVRAGILRAVLVRRDPAWAIALHRSTPDPRLLDLLPEQTRADVIVRLLAARKPPTGLHLATLLGHLPPRWSPELSAQVVRVLRADAGATTIQQATPVLAQALDATAQTSIEAWLSGLEEQPQLAAALRTLVQYQSLHRSITEAFS